MSLREIQRMAERVRKPKISMLIAAVLLLGVCMLFPFRIRSCAAEINVSWNSLTLTKDGDCNWSMAYLGPLEVDKYELRLARKNNGSWNTNYKSTKTTDSSYTFSITSSGQYYFTIRALFVGGDKSTWSGQSNTVSVSSEDVDHGSTPGASPAYYIVPTGNGNYVVPAGPGVNTYQYQYQYQSTTIGPGSNVTNNTYGGQSVISGGPGGIPAGTITGDNGASGWVRDGNRWRYRYANNTYAVNSWDHIDKDWYYFDNNGCMATGWVYYNNNWYLCGTDGRMRTGWNMVNNKWYYMDNSGIMQTGYITVDGIHYYCDSTGARVQGGYNPDGHYFDESGVQIK